MGNFVRWRGHAAVYTPDERQIMCQLPVKEQAFVHLLKAFTDGEISCPVDSPEDPRLIRETSEQGAPNLKPAPERRPATQDSHSGNGLDTHRAQRTEQRTQDSQSWIDPEDIPFGDKPKRVKKTYALVWTWRAHRVYKTKGKAQAKLKVWKKWYERQGWKVHSHATGYFAANKEGDRHAISLHEYDRETRERL